ncbi:pol protein [Perkinsela sp. CCAP 1560/4]|nr:pol protein [Perkinsela sp. CCAP 1560/4]|eukprot:KNH03781.1 pol protein [Perkinsela sp. CCAP 1560/4]
MKPQVRNEKKERGFCGSEPFSQITYQDAREICLQPFQHEKLQCTFNHLQTIQLDKLGMHVLENYVSVLQGLCDGVHPELYHHSFALKIRSIKSLVLLSIDTIVGTLCAMDEAYMEHFHILLFFHFSLLTDETQRRIFTTGWKLLNSLISFPDVQYKERYNVRINKEELVRKMAEGLTILTNSCIFFLLNKSCAHRNKSFVTQKTLPPTAWLTHFAYEDAQEALKLVRVLCAHLLRTLTTHIQLGCACAGSLIFLCVSVHLNQKQLEAVTPRNVFLKEALKLLQELRCWCSRALDTIYRNVSMNQKYRSLTDAILVVPEQCFRIIDWNEDTPISIKNEFIRFTDEAMSCFWSHLPEKDVSIVVEKESADRTKRSEYSDVSSSQTNDDLSLEITQVLLANIAECTSSMLCGKSSPPGIAHTNFAVVALTHLQIKGRMPGTSTNQHEESFLQMLAKPTSAPRKLNQICPALIVSTMLALSKIFHSSIVEASFPTYAFLLSLIEKKPLCTVVLENCKSHTVNYVENIANTTVAKSDAPVDYFLDGGIRPALNVWKAAFCSDSVSEEGFGLILDLFLASMPIDIQLIQRAVYNDLCALHTSTSPVFWQTTGKQESDSTVNIEDRPHGDTNELLRLVASAVNRRTSGDAVFLKSSLIELLPVNNTLNVLSHVACMIRNFHAQCSVDKKRVFKCLDAVLRRCAYFIGSRDILKNEFSESLFRDMSLLKERIEHVFASLKTMSREDNIFTDPISFQLKKSISLLLENTILQLSW